MRIAHIIPDLRRGGAERLCLDIVRKLSSVESVQVLLLTLRDLNHYADEYQDVTPLVTGCSVIPSLSGKWTVDIELLNNILREFRPHIIHSHLFEAEVATRFNPVRGVGYFTHCHDNMPQLRRFAPADLLDKRRLTELYERHYLIGRYRGFGNRFIAISADTESYFKENLPQDLASSVHLMHNAIDYGRFSEQRADTLAGTGRLRLVNVGSFVPKKNQTFLLDVLSELRRSGQDAELLLLGDGPLRPLVMQRAAQMGLSDHVTCPGVVGRVETHLWESHIYVHSATYEPFGLVLLEAMAAGLPVVSLNGKGNVGLVRDGFNGFMPEGQHAERFTQSVLQCISDSATWATMSNNAREFSRSFDMGAYTERLLDLYTQSLAQ